MSANKPNQLEIHRADSDVQIHACYDLVALLRPSVVRSEFVETVRWMYEYDSYSLIYGIFEGEIVVVCGFRQCTTLAGGSVWRVEELVTAEDQRRNGHASAVLDHLVDEADRLSVSSVEVLVDRGAAEVGNLFSARGFESAGAYLVRDIDAAPGVA